MKAAELGTQYFYIYVIDIWYFMTVPWFWRVLFILHALLLGLSGPMIWNKKISQVPQSYIMNHSRTECILQEGFSLQSHALLWIRGNGNLFCTRSNSCLGPRHIFIEIGTCWLVLIGLIHYSCCFQICFCKCKVSTG
jgi:hypothetical protein